MRVSGPSLLIESTDSMISMVLLLRCNIIGASLSEPHTNHCYEKIAVVMYVAIRRPCVYSACAYV